MAKYNWWKHKDTRILRFETADLNISEPMIHLSDDQGQITLSPGTYNIQASAAHNDIWGIDIDNIAIARQYGSGMISTSFRVENTSTVTLRPDNLLEGRIYASGMVHNTAQ